MPESFGHYSCEMKSSCIAILFLSFLPGCTSSFQGIRIRAESPAIAETFKKLTLAVNVDGYEIESVDHGRYSLETQWRELKDNERIKNETGKVKLKIQLHERGRLYDVRLTPLVQKNAEDSQVITDVQHPLITKWKRILHSIVTKESRDED